jgi:hypothetical protein
MLNPSSGERARIGIPDEDFEYDKKTLPGWRRKIADWFSMQNTSALYKYDFGDNWRHTVTLEKILPRQRDVTYSRCVGGRRACPPEDCGGIWGYQDICDGKSAFQENYWDYNPNYFNAAEVSNNCICGGTVRARHAVPLEISHGPLAPKTRPLPYAPEPPG